MNLKEIILPNIWNLWKTRTNSDALYSFWRTFYYNSLQHTPIIPVGIIMNDWLQEHMLHCFSNIRSHCFSYILSLCYKFRLKKS